MINIFYLKYTRCRAKMKTCLHPFTFALLFISFNEGYTQTSHYKLSILCKDSTIKKIEILFIRNDSSFSVEDKILYTDRLDKCGTGGQILFPYAVYFRYNDSIRTPMFFIQKGEQTINVISMSDPVEVSPEENITNEYYQKYLSNYALSHNKDKSGIEINPCIELWDLYFKVMKSGYNLSYEKALSNIDAKIGKNEISDKINQMLAASSRIRLNNTFPVLRLYDLNKKLENLDFSKSKYTLIDFWFADCSPCIKQFEYLKGIYSKYYLKGLRIIAISIDEEKDRYRLVETIHKNKYVWDNLWDIDAKNADILNIHSYPKSFLIDSRGQIAGINLSISDLEKILQKNLE